MAHSRLIILPCHAIWKAQNSDSVNGQSADEWHLAPFQIEGHDHLCFIDHISRSFSELKNDPDAILIISGGQTKAEAGPVSEALSYYQLAQRLIGETDRDLFRRVYLEEYARDSLENVLFSFCRYYEVSESYPQFVTVVGFEFKRSRFLNYHLEQAFGVPESRVTYIGNSPSPGPEVDHDAYFQSLASAEKKHAIDHFANDIYGLRDPLRAKRAQRDPFHRYHGYESSNPNLRTFLGAIRTYIDEPDDEMKQLFEKGLHSGVQSWLSGST